MNKLDKNLILKQLPKNISVYLFDEIDSTNTYAKLNEAINVNSLVATTSQTHGRGRYNRYFYSPKDAGLYFSYVINPLISEIEFMTLKMAVAICLTLEDFKLSPSIKWLNDVYLNKKKVSGILCEGVFQGSNLTKFIIGVGINIQKTVVPNDLKDKMISLEECGLKNIDYNKLLIEIIRNFNQLQDNQLILKEYRNRCFTLGQEVTINNISGTAIDITDQGYLLLETKLKEQIIIRTGEII